MYREIGLIGYDWNSEAIQPFLGACLLVALVPYLMGSINPSLIQARRAGVDIRKEGSGNPGTTNTLRVLGKKAAVITLLVDIFKGVLAVVLAGLLFGEKGAMVACLFVFLGHVYPLFGHFKGGKGVATAFGALAALHPAIGFGCLGVVLLAVALTRYVSFGSLFGAIACPVLTYIFLPAFLPESCIMAAVVIWRHRSNIQRLIRHEESKISLKKKTESGDDSARKDDQNAEASASAEAPGEAGREQSAGPSQE